MNNRIFGEMVIFAGNAGEILAEKVCCSISQIYEKLDKKRRDELGIDSKTVMLSKARVGKFADGEPDLQLLDSVHGKDVYIINPTCQPDRNLIELILLTDAVRGSSAGRITLVIPYFGYARKDYKDAPRVPETTKVICKIISMPQLKVDKVILLDLHSDQITGFFDVRVVSQVYSSYFALSYIKSEIIKDYHDSVVFASADVGRGKMVKAYAKRAGCGYVIFDKDRIKANIVDEKSIRSAEGFDGGVKGKILIFIEDMIDTAGSLFLVSNAAKLMGALKIYAYATHSVLSEDAVEKISKSAIDKVIITDSIYRDSNLLNDKFEIISCAPLLAEAIFRSHHELSFEGLFL